MFQDKVILITGASSGIGKATALLFAKEKAKIAFTYNSNQQGAYETQKELEALGCETLCLQANLMYEEQSKNIVQKTLEKFGKIDVLINNAGGYMNGDFYNGESDVWLKTLQQNLMSLLYVSKFVIEIFQKQTFGVMVNVASRYAYQGNADAISYGAAKAGIVNITQAYAQLLSPFGRANVICPGAVEAGYWLRASPQERQAQGNLLKPAFIAQKILFLASDEAREINGQNIFVHAE